MSSNPLVPESTKLLGNKTEHSTELNELLSEDKTEKSPLCHFCMKDNKESFTCKECHNVFCLDCFKEISKKKDSTKEFVPLSEEEKQKWVCFICEGTCTCKACTLMKNEKAEKKCILCKATTNLIKIDEMIQKLNLSDKEKEDYINQHSPISLLLFDNGINEKFICKSCYNSNYIVNKFLQGEKIEIPDQPQPQITNKEESKVPPSQNSNDATPQGDSTQTNNQNPPSIIPQTINIEKTQPPKPQMSQTRPEQHQINNLNLNDNNNMMPLQFPNIGLPQPAAFPQGPMPNPFMGAQLPQNGSPQSLSASFSQISESLQNFNNQNLQNNYNILNNVNKFKELLTNMLDNNKEKEQDPNNQNKEDNAPMMNYLMEVIEDLKKQIVTMQYYTQMQKYFIDYITKNVENFIEQINSQQAANQQMLNDFKKNQFLQNQGLPMQNPLFNDLLKPPMTMPPMLMNPIQPGLMGLPGMGLPLGSLPGLPNLGGIPNSMSNPTGNQQDKKTQPNKMSSMPMMMNQGMSMPGMMSNEPMNPNLLAMMKKLNDPQNMMVNQGSQSMQKMNNRNPQPNMGMPPQMDMGINPMMFNLQTTTPGPNGFMNMFGDKDQSSMPAMNNMPSNLPNFNSNMMNPSTDPMLLQMLMGRQNLNKEQNDKGNLNNNNKDN